MFIQPSRKNRPFHFDPFPLETLLRDESVTERQAARPKVAAVAEPAPEGPLARAATHYRELFAKFADGEHAPCPLDRKAALAAKDLLETPADACTRHAQGGLRPAHYIPTPAVELAAATRAAKDRTTNPPSTAAPPPRALRW